MRHIQGASRQQATLLPERLEDYVPDHHPVRVIDAFVDTLHLADLGFAKAQAKHTGRKPYDPADLLKLYIYGYLNQVRSSRRLERECQRNLELMWLVRRLAPDFKTIANFRKDNSAAIQAASRAFILFCKQTQLLNGQRVAIDGSKFKAAASLDQALTRKHLNHRRDKLDARIRRYLEQLDEHDNQDTEPELDREQIKNALKQLQQRRAQLDTREQWMNDNDTHQHCQTEPDAKIMRSGREGKVCGYNLQSAVDCETGVIIHHQLTNEATDNRQLQPMVNSVKETLEPGSLEILADAGYSNGEQMSVCEKHGMTLLIPSNRSVNNQGEYYQKSDFQYDAKQNHFVCPAGKILAYQTKHSKSKLYKYARTGCSDCPQQAQCTKADKRWVSRHFYESTFEAVKARLKTQPDAMKERMAKAERPFAQIKQAMGLRRFLCWGIESAAGEAALGVLSYNLARMTRHIGAKELIAALK